MSSQNVFDYITPTNKLCQHCLRRKRPHGKIILRLSWLLLSALLLSSCVNNIQSDNTKIDEIDSNEVQIAADSIENNYPIIDSDQSEHNAMIAFRDVLYRKADYYDAVSDTLLNINQWYERETIMPSDVQSFSVLDLDGDGISEIILKMTVSKVQTYGFLILRYEGDTVVGYTLWSRAFLNLKSDGTVSFSSGVYDQGFGRIDFSAFNHNTGHSIVKPVCYCKSGGYEMGELGLSDYVSYYDDGNSITSAEFDLAMQQQREKEDVTWLDYSEKDIEFFEKY